MNDLTEEHRMTTKIVNNVIERGYNYTESPATGMRANALKAVEEAIELALLCIGERDQIYGTMTLVKTLIGDRFDFEMIKLRGGMIEDGNPDIGKVMSEVADVYVTLANVWNYAEMLAGEDLPTPIEQALVKSSLDKGRGRRK